jgi:uncharacterized protein YegL
MRRLPVYILLDTSGSMRGEPIEAVKVGLQTMLSSLRQDPFALESLHIALITFDREATVLCPLTDIGSLQIPDIVVPESGPTHLGAALELLVKSYDTDVIRSTADVKGDWKPLAFIMTDGSPSDLMLYRHMIPQVRQRSFSGIIGCAAGSLAKKEILLELCTEVVSLDTTDSATFSSYFKWVSASIATGNMSMGASSGVVLPPPPPEIHTVVT